MQCAWINGTSVQYRLTCGPRSRDHAGTFGFVFSGVQTMEVQTNTTRSANITRSNIPRNRDIINPCNILTAQNFVVYKLPDCADAETYRIQSMPDILQTGGNTQACDVTFDYNVSVVVKLLNSHIRTRFAVVVTLHTFCVKRKSCITRGVIQYKKIQLISG